MVITSKTRLGKRKIEIKEIRKENQITTSKKHDRKCFSPPETSTKEKVSAPMKPETKSDLLDKMKLVEQLNDALLEEVKHNEEAIVALEKKEKKHIAAIKSLEERIEKLKTEIIPKSNSDSGTQTSLDPGNSELQIPCNICIYVATCEEELNWHIEDEHDIKTDLHFETDFPCEICGKWCRTVEDLTYHLKRHEFDSLPLESQSLVEQIACHNCDETFATKDGVMKHRKRSHLEKVKTCIFYSQGKCDHGDECWFIHDTKSRDNQSEETDRLNCRLCDKTLTSGLTS